MAHLGRPYSLSVIVGRRHILDISIVVPTLYVNSKLKLPPIPDSPR